MSVRPEDSKVCSPVTGAVGSEILGISPTAPSTSRSKVAAISTVSAAQCCTTTVFALAIQEDPAAEVVRRMPAAWFLIWPHTQNFLTEVRVAWRRAWQAVEATKPDMQGSKVAGPIMP